MDGSGNDKEFLVAAGKKAIGVFTELAAVSLLAGYD